MAKITFMKYISWSQREEYSTEHDARGEGVAIPVVKPFLYLLHIMI